MKLFLKRLFLLLGYVLTAPLIIPTWLEKLLLGDRTSPWYGSCKELLSLCPTPVGEILRLAYYRAVCRDISPDVCFMFGSMLARRDISIGPGVVLGVHCIFGYANIGAHVLFGARVSLLSGKYQHGRPGQHSGITETAGEFKTIEIAGNSWIGQDSVIMANIGSGCTVAAGSVVYRDVADGITVMGNPARRVSM